MEKRNNYNPGFKAKVVLESLREEKTVNQLAAEHGINPVMISRWKAEFLEKAHQIFEKGADEADKIRKKYETKQEQLEREIGQLTIEVDWLKKKSCIE